MNESPPIEERMRAFIAIPDDSDWDDVLRRAEVAETRTTLVRPRTIRWVMLRRRSLVPALAVLMLLIAGAAFAAVGVIPWWQGGTPPVDPQAVVAVARDNMPANVDIANARTVAQTGQAALIAVPLDRSGYCLIPTLGDRGVLGAQCEYQVLSPRTGDDDRLESYAQPASRPGGPAWVLYGRITDPDAATLDLSEAVGAPFEITLQPGGFFLAKIPADRWTTLANAAGPGRILDTSGKSLRAGCVNWGPSPTSIGAGHDVLLWSAATSGACKPQTQPPTLATAGLAHSHKLVELTLTSNYSIYKQGTTIALWENDGADGSKCVFEAKADEAPTQLGGNNPAGSGGCNASGTWATPNPIEVTLGATRLPDGSYAGLLQGHVNPTSGISRLELTNSTGTADLAFANGWFLAQLPKSGDVHLPAGGPWLLTGYNAAGNKIAQVDLDELQRKAEPH